MSPNQLAAEAVKLSMEERLVLLAAIWESMAATAERLPLPRAHREELDRRLQDLEQNPGDDSSWAEVRSRMEARSRSRR
jgi:putative addiction module component (TIGR02574 family)